MNVYSDNVICYVDLSDGKIREEEITREMRERYIGGNGLNVKLLFESEALQAHPLSEENRLIIGAGPTGGTTLPSGNRCTITAKSPLSGIYGDSNVGGKFNSTLRSNGIDHLVFTGKSKDPVYLYIENKSKIEIRPAEDLWGSGTDTVTDILIQRHGKDCEVACIGQAGENLVYFATIMMAKTHAAGRTGMGCVMGSKNLKAIVVRKNSKKPFVYNPEKVKSLCKSMRKHFKRSVFGKQMSINGSLYAVESYAKNRTLQCCNSKEMSADEAENVTAKHFVNKNQTGRKACPTCPIGCIKEYRITAGKHKGEQGESLDLGPLMLLGPMLGIFDYNPVLHLKTLADRYGMDVIELGNLLGMAIECYEKGLITREDTDGLELQWNAPDVIEQLMNHISLRKGFGNVLADGTKKASITIGGEKYGFAVKGVGTGLLQTNRKAWALGYLTAVRGGDHLKNTPFSMAHGKISATIAMKIFNSERATTIDSSEEKGRVVWWHENHKTILDSLGLCKFAICALATMGYMYFDELADMMNALFGTKMDGIAMIHAAERIYQMQYAFNMKNGINLTEHQLPERTKENGIDEDFLRQTTIDTRHPGMLPEYMQYRGLAPTGQQTVSRLKEVGLQHLESKIKCSDEESISIARLLKTVNINIEFTETERIQFDKTSALLMQELLDKTKEEAEEFKDHRFGHIQGVSV